MSSVTGLSSTFTSLINNLMMIERQPLTRLQEQRDNLNVQLGAYNDASTQLKDLQSAVNALRSNTTTTSDPALVPGYNAAVSNAPTGTTILTANTSRDAIAGIYNISVATLAKEHRVRSAQQIYFDQALNLSGTILVGGAASRSQSTVSTIANTMSAFNVATPDADQTEIGTGTYYIETRNDGTNGWQFRLVDAEGKAVSIKPTDVSSDYTNGWQAITPGTHDTGRGLTLNFGSDSSLYQAASKGLGAAQVNYTAQGASITIANTDSLNDVASKINDASYAQGNGVSAMVIDRQLVLVAANTGTAHTIVASDSSGTVLQSLGLLTAGGAFQNVMQTPANASFTVNGISVTRSANTGLSDVISGVTLNLAPDAETKNATLTITSDWSGATNAINSFLTKFNSVQTYLAAKTEVTVDNTGDTPTYTRGALSDDNTFKELRSDLFQTFMSTAGAGAYKSFSDIGLTIGDDLHASVSDSDKLQAALSSNPDAVKDLMNQVMASFDSLLSRYTGSSDQTGYITSTVSTYNDQITSMNAQIKDKNVSLDEYQVSLINQYAALQSQLASLSYMQQTMNSLYSSFSQSM